MNRSHDSSPWPVVIGRLLTVQPRKHRHLLDPHPPEHGLSTGFLKNGEDALALDLPLPQSQRPAFDWIVDHYSVLRGDEVMEKRFRIEPTLDFEVVRRANVIGRKDLRVLRIRAVKPVEYLSALKEIVAQPLRVDHRRFDAKIMVDLLIVVDLEHRRIREEIQPDEALVQVEADCKQTTSEVLAIVGEKRSILVRHFFTPSNR